MIEGENKILQAFLATLLTWGLTAAGASLVFIFGHEKISGQKKFLNLSLGFASGVMIAASFWSLLAPGMEMAEESGTYGKDGKYAFAPVAIGFSLGGAFVMLTEFIISRCNIGKDMLDDPENHVKAVAYNKNITNDLQEKEVNIESNGKVQHPNGNKDPLKNSDVVLDCAVEMNDEKEKAERESKYQSWKRMILLVISITVHNAPEGLAVGVAFAAIGSTNKATFAAARNLAIAIGIQNFPEGMAVSIPLGTAGYSRLKSFWYGQLSGMVEPIFGVLGALVTVVAEPILPYALAFAAGAMIYVVVDDLIPEATSKGHSRWASVGCMIGFIIMMCLESI